MFGRRRSFEERKKESNALVLEAYDALDRGDAKLVLRLAKKVRALKNSAAFELWGRAYWLLNRRRKAIDVLRRGTKEYPQVAILWSYLGEFYSETGQYEEALAAFEKSAAGHGGHRWLADYNIALVEWRRKQPEKALLKLNLIPPGTDRPPAWLIEEVRSTALFDLGRFEEALESADDALRVFDGSDLPSHSRISLARAQALLALGRGDDALEEIRAAIASDKCVYGAPEILRKVRNRRSPAAKRWRLDIAGAWGEEKGMPLKFETTFLVIAESEEEALEYCLEFEPRAIVSTVTVTRSKMRSEAPDDLLGVERVIGGYTVLSNERRVT